MTGKNKTRGCQEHSTQMRGVCVCECVCLCDCVYVVFALLYFVCVILVVTCFGYIKVVI